MPSGEDLRKQATDAVRSGNFSGARGLLARARQRAAGDRDLLALIDVSLAYIEAETKGSARGIEMCRSLLDLDGLREETRGEIWAQLGLLQMRKGDHASAMAAFSEAIPMIGGHTGLLGRALLNRGITHLHLSAPQEALGDLTQALEHFTDAGAVEARGKAEHNLGYAQLLLGDPVSALRSMDAAARTMSPMSAVMRAASDQDRAEVFLAAGRPHEAIEALESAAAAYAEQRLRRFQAECEYVLARTLLHEETVRARSVARKAARRFTEQSMPAWARRAEATALVAEIALGARTTGLRDLGDRLVRELRRHRHRGDADELALHVVRLSIRRGELDDAAARLRRIRMNDDTPIGTRLLAQEVKAELAQAKGQRRRALDHVRAGLKDLHAWQASFGSLDLQSTMVGHGNALARLGLQLALEDGRAEVVFEWSERARALASKVTTLRPPPDPDLAADLTALRLLDGDDPAKARELRERIRSKSWYAAEGSVGEPVALDVLQARLHDDDAVLVAHIVVDDALTALVATGDGSAVVPLGEARSVRDQLDRIAADLDFAAHNTGGPFADTVRASLQDDLAAVADRLVTPLLDLIGGRRVVLTPSALLAGTPWTLLPGLNGRPLTVPASATRWLELVEMNCWRSRPDEDGSWRGEPGRDERQQL